MWRYYRRQSDDGGVYEVTLHWAHCGFCKDDHGIHVGDNHEGWSRAFDSIIEAKRAALSHGVGLKYCRRCKDKCEAAELLQA